MTTVIGIDPGLTGALACIIDGELLDVVDMPTAGGLVSGIGVCEVLREFQWAGMDDSPLVVVEKVGAMPGQGVASMFKFGRSLGVIEGAVAGKCMPLRWVTPQVWKGSRGLLRQDKDAARLLALELWPAHAATFALRKDVGRADAALIAAWGAGL